MARGGVAEIFSRKLSVTKTSMLESYGKRAWFSGRIRPCQGRVGGSIPPARKITSEASVLCEAEQAN